MLFNLIRRRMSTATTTTRTYADAINALNSLQTNFATIEAIRKAGGKSNQNAIPQMLEWARRAGYPDVTKFDPLNVIHVTGTKGKGSTCAFVQSILQQYQGISTTNKKIEKIGLYTSPHLKSVRERIRVNGDPISEEKFAKYFFEVWDNIEASKSDVEQFPEAADGLKPGYFRYLTILSFHVFIKEGVDTAIYEVGIGGEYDSTNIIKSPSVTGVSSLGIDHVNILGNTIESIAWNKGGIYKSSAPALTVEQPENGLKVLEERATERNTTLTVVETYPELDQLKLGLHGNFQKINASLAIKLAAIHLEKQGIISPGEVSENKLPEKFVKGLEQASWPGRCQTIEDGKTQWLLDGAHTKESITVAAEWFAGECTRSGTKVLLFNQQTRDANALLGTLHEVLQSHDVQFDHVIFSTNVTFSSGKYSADLTSLNTSKDEVDALTVQRALSDAWAQADSKAERHVFSSIQEAYEFVKHIDEPSQVFVTGSLHLVGGLLAVHED